jgi:hypothetical protein
VDEGLSVLNIEAGNCEIVYYGYAPEACQTLTVMVNGGTAPYTYAWSNGAATPSTNVCPTVTTIYSIVVTDSNGNTAEDNVTVQVIDVRCGNNNNKVLVCHAPNQSVICISSSAVPDHLSHGDYLGVCGAPDPCAGENQSMTIAQQQQEYDASRTDFSPFEKQDEGDGSVFTLTPNPANDQLYVKMNPPSGIIKVIDVSGMVILHQVVYGADNIINTASLADGIYYVQLETGKYCRTKNFVVMH